MVKYLCVAEKPSIAKSITQILSGGQWTTRQTSVGWIKNYDFNYRLNGVETRFTVTSVSGHLFDTDFDQELRPWSSCDPFTLFEANINRFINPDPNKKGIERNLSTESRNASHLMIWTDCDREGEHIGSEVMDICKKVNRNLIVKRARFSAIIPNQIHNACRNPVDLDMKQANAVTARIELDLRVGAILTRFQTMAIQSRIPALERDVISYGPCQFPTLGFVVDQYEKVQAFIAEDFWSIQLSLQREDSSVFFTWKRGRLFDFEVASMLFELVQEAGEATVLRQQTKPTQKWKPLPLTTVELQKTGSRLLHLSPKQILDISDALYQKGFLSYPRTETDQFDKDFNFDEMIQKQTTDTVWGDFATGLMNGNFEKPRNGKKNDQAHPPIHPTAHVSNLEGNDKRVYDLVTRRFLACCSSNARGFETVVEVEIGGEEFTAKGLIIQQKNYLEVYVYDKWNGNLLPDFQVGEVFVPDSLELKEGRTSSPNLLTEADLVSLMDKNGIGTDATIAEHINKVIDRKYVMKQKEGQVEYLFPSTLGIGLVEGYNSIGFEKSICKPHLRRQTEHRMNQVCLGTKTKSEMMQETLDEYREMYLTAKLEFETVIQTVSRYVEGDGADQADAHQNNNGDMDDDNGGRGDGGGGNGRRNPPARRGAPAARGARGGNRGAAPPARRPPPPRYDDDDEDENDDNPRFPPPNADVPNCKCDEPAVEKTVTKESDNKGRKFFACSKGMEGGCGFFEWSGEPATGNGKNVPQKRAYGNSNGNQQQNRSQSYNNNRNAQTEFAEGQRCQCDLTPTIQTVKKEGPNTGRRFFCCSNSSASTRCKYFVWEDELENDSGPAPKRVARAPSQGVTGECFHCNESGHWASSCPNKGESAGAGGGGDRSCYKCGEAGHFANNCDSNEGGSSRGNARGGRGSRGGTRARGRARGRGK